MEKEFGEIIRITYRNSDNWSVFTIVDEHGVKHDVTGILPSMCDEGTIVTVNGEVDVHPQYGKKIKASSIVPEPPDIETDEGVEKLLTRLPGIGPVKASKFVAKHGGEKAFKLASEDPCLAGVKECDADTAREILSQLLGDSDTLIYLLSIGVTSNKADTIILRYGAEEAFNVVTTDPYRMIADIDGFGFLTVDKIALSAGMSIGNASRIAACVDYCLNESEVNNGNTYIPAWELCAVVISILTDSAGNAGVSVRGMPGKEDVRKVIWGMVDEDKLVVDNGKVFSKVLLEAEQNIMAQFGMLD